MQNSIYTITVDNINEKGNTDIVPREDHTLPFRLLDDDGIVYFKGLMINLQTETLFYPLDTLGSSYGCTEIQIYEKGHWSTV